MTRDPIVRRRQMKMAVAVLLVGIVVSALVATVLIYMAGAHHRS